MKEILTIGVALWGLAVLAIAVLYCLKMRRNRKRDRQLARIRSVVCSCDEQQNRNLGGIVDRGYKTGERWLD